RCRECGSGRAERDWRRAHACPGYRQGRRRQHRRANGVFHPAAIRRRSGRARSGRASAPPRRPGPPRRTPVKITDLKIVPFVTHADRFRNGQAFPNTELVQTITSIATDAGAVGYYFGGGSHGDQEGLHTDDRELLLGRIRSLLIGQDPFDRELIWKWLWVANIPEHVASVVDLALWDLAGRALDLPVYKLLGGARDRVKAYASTYPNVGSPEQYAEHALDCQRAGYLAYKIHPHYFWDPATRSATPGRPSNVDWDIETCRLVRQAVGPDYTLMYDPWG